ncbi:MAG TPA: hypothetical protein VKA38_13990 [Draconibacterium sp.]|nr:hypothetical protein [Draconibacterium sp.]
MESTTTFSMITSALTLLMILSGIKLRKSGEPYKTGVFTLHKLSVVATIVFVVLIYIKHFKLLYFEGFGLFLFIFSGLVFIIAFITGALLGFEKIATYKLKIMHRILSWFTILFIPVIWLYCH